MNDDLIRKYFFMSIVEYQSQQQAIPVEIQKSIENLLVKHPKEPRSQNYHIKLQCPNEASPQLPKWKWALVFRSVLEVNQFIQELKYSEEKKHRLAIQEYSVFRNVMFAFMRRQMKLNQWAHFVCDMIDNQPLAIFVFNLRFKQLADFADRGISIYYSVDWNYVMQMRKYKKATYSDEEDDLSSSSSSSSSDQPQKKIKAKQFNYQSSEKSSNISSEKTECDDDSQSSDINTTNPQKELIIINAMKNFSIDLQQKLNMMTEYITGLISILTKMQEDYEEK